VFEEPPRVRSLFSPASPLSPHASEDPRTPTRVLSLSGPRKKTCAMNISAANGLSAEPTHCALSNLTQRQERSLCRNANLYKFLKLVSRLRALSRLVPRIRSHPGAPQNVNFSFVSHCHNQLEPPNLTAHHHRGCPTLYLESHQNSVKHLPAPALTLCAFWRLLAAINHHFSPVFLRFSAFFKELNATRSPVISTNPVGLGVPSKKLPLELFGLQ
jgi:hypothetical protein